MIDKQDRLSIVRGDVPDHLHGEPEVFGLVGFAHGLFRSSLEVERARIRDAAWVFAAADAGLDAEEIATARLPFAAQDEDREAAENALLSEVNEVAEFFKNRDLFDIDDVANRIGYLIKAELPIDTINSALDAHDAAFREAYLEAEEDDG